MLLLKTKRQSIMKPFMIYTGNHLFHYTNFESALKIIVTRSLKFGNFEDMNDIAEANREVFGMVADNIIYKALSEYHSISLTLDNSSRRGFSIDPLWGHYAQKGNGVCLVFDKNTLYSSLKKQFGNNAIIAPIIYKSDYTGTVFTDGHTEDEVKKYIANYIDNIFFTKSVDWEYEHELRILVKESNEYFYFGEDSLIAVILCLPKVWDYKDSPEFKILKDILPNKPILRYTTRFGNRELLNEVGDKMCGIIGLDWQLET
jgi:hypothetical protein